MGFTQEEGVRANHDYPLPPCLEARQRTAQRHRAMAEKKLRFFVEEQSAQLLEFFPE